MLTRVPGAYSQGFFVCPSPEVAHQEYLKPTSAVPTVVNVHSQGRQLIFVCNA